MEVMHQVDNGIQADLDLVRSCGILDYVLESLPKAVESWPTRTKVLLLKILQISIRKSKENSKYLLSDDHLTNIVEYLLQHTEADCFSSNSLHSNSVELLMMITTDLVRAAWVGEEELFQGIVGYLSCCGILYQIRDSLSLFDPSKVTLISPDCSICTDPTFFAGEG